MKESELELELVSGWLAGWLCYVLQKRSMCANQNKCGPLIRGDGGKFINLR